MKTDPSLQHQRDIADIARSAKVRIDLHTQGGQILVQMMEALLADRIAVLVEKDEYCRGLLDFLNQIGYQVKEGAEKSARVFAREAMGE